MVVPRINSGDLRHRILIQGRTGTQDAAGQPDASDAQWETAATVWASVTAITGKDVYALGSGFTAQVSHKIVMRYNAAFLTSNMRVLYGGQTFLVVAPPFDPDGRQEQLQLVCMVQDK